MQALEDKVNQLQQEKAVMKAEMSATLHLDEHLCTFNDGWVLVGHYWSTDPSSMELEGPIHYHRMPLDRPHAEATAFYDMLTFSPTGGSETVVLGQEGRRTTVEQMLSQLRAWWLHWAPTYALAK